MERSRMTNYRCQLCGSHMRVIDGVVSEDDDDTVILELECMNHRRRFVDTQVSDSSENLIPYEIQD